MSLLVAILFLLLLSSVLTFYLLLFCCIVIIAVLFFIFCCVKHSGLHFSMKGAIQIKFHSFIHSYVSFESTIISVFWIHVNLCFQILAVIT